MKTTAFNLIGLVRSKILFIMKYQFWQIFFFNLCFCKLLPQENFLGEYPCSQSSVARFCPSFPASPVKKFGKLLKKFGQLLKGKKQV